MLFIPLASQVVTKASRIHFPFLVFRPCDRGPLKRDGPGSSAHPLSVFCGDIVAESASTFRHFPIKPRGLASVPVSLALEFESWEMLALPGSDHPLPDEAEDTAVPGVLVVGHLLSLDH